MFRARWRPKPRRVDAVAIRERLAARGGNLSVKAEGAQELFAQALAALLVPMAGFVNFGIRLGPDDQAIDHKERRMRSIASSRGMASCGLVL